MENLVETLGFAEHQYIAARHNDKDHEHVHVAINKIHPETFRIHSPAWDHQKLFTAGPCPRTGARPHAASVESARSRESPADGRRTTKPTMGSTASLAGPGRSLVPHFEPGELRSWDDVARRLRQSWRRASAPWQRPRLRGCRAGRAREGVIRGPRAQQAAPLPTARSLPAERPRISWKLQELRPGGTPPPLPIAPQGLWKEYEQSLIQARTQRQEAWDSYRHAAARERQELKQKYRRQRNVINALPVSARDRGQLVRQLALRQTMETRALRRKLAIQRKAIQKTWHPGTWRHFVASRAAQRDARAIRPRERRERERGGSEQEREL